MIEIRQPELEALILERFQTGAFESVEDVILQALTEAPLLQATSSPGVPRSGSELFDALIKSPYKEVDLEPERYVSHISDPVQL